MGRRAVKRCLLDMTSLTDSQHRQLLTQETRKAQANQNSSVVGQGLIGPPPLDEELLESMVTEGQGNQFSPETWLY